MTPFIDVMLVLLIIFMVAAPMMVTGVPIDLPSVNAPTLESKDQPLIVSLKPNGEIYLMDSEDALDLNAIVPLMKKIANNDLNRTVYIKINKDTSYDYILQLMEKISSAGFKKVGFRDENK